MKYDIIWRGVTPDGRNQLDSLSPRDWGSAGRAEKTLRKRLKRAGYTKVKIKILRRGSQKKKGGNSQRPKVSDWTGRTRKKAVGSHLKSNWLFNPPHPDPPARRLSPEAQRREARLQHPVRGSENLSNELPRAVIAGRAGRALESGDESPRLRTPGSAGSGSTPPE